MSYNFSANQFEPEFKAKRLNNWEVPKWYPDRPKQPRKTPTRIIVNDRGHLLPGIQRVPGDSPWGNYIGTWDLPKKITRKLAYEINRDPKFRRAAWERRSSHVPLTLPGTVVPPRVPTTKKNGDPSESKPAEVDQILSGENIEMRHQTSAGSVRCPHHQKINNNNNNNNDNNNNNNYNNRKPTPPISRTSSGKSSKSTLIPPLAGAYSNFQLARKLHRENLEHKPLPDTVQDSLYRSLQAKKTMNPGKSLAVGTPRVSAVGFRGYGASGPNQCSKLRVYRPKTAPGVDTKQEEVILPTRPSTGRVSDMQLAICWDLKPPRPEDEPKPSPHIDGSNGSAAPAVFALVHQPQPQLLTEDVTTKAICGTINRGGDRINTPPERVLSGSQPHRNNCNTKQGCQTPPHLGNSALINGYGTPPNKGNCGTKVGCGVSPNYSIKNGYNTPTSRENCGTKQGCGTPPNSELQNGYASLNNRGNCGTKEGCGTPPNYGVRNGYTTASSKGNCGNKEGCGTPPNSGLKNGYATLHNRGNCGTKEGCGTPPNSGLKNGYTTLPNRGNCGTKEGCGTPPVRHEIKENRNPNMDRRHQSSPNLRQVGSRPCMACEVKTFSPECHPQQNYKMAFKAGKPNNSFDSGSTRPVTAKQVKIPKPRAPFAKRSYSIDTLSPPFSLWPGHTGQDYPEHWRLASVYQHAYKPVETRRKPLLASVYQ